MSEQAVGASISVDGDKLAAALRRVTPFMAEKGRENLSAVYVESDGQTLQLTATDGFRMAHLTVMLPFPAGNYLLKGDGAKDFAFRHFNGAQVGVEPGQGFIKLGDVRVELVATPYVDYTALLPQTFDIEAIVDTKKWIKAIRGSGAETVGIVYSAAGCLMYSQNIQGETIGCDPLPVQMISGPERKVAYKAEHFRRALTSCGATATIQVGAADKPTVFEAEDYWHLLQPRQGFPKEVTLTQGEREALKWAEEALRSILSGEVVGRVLVGGGKFYLELSPSLTVTQVLTEEPHLLTQEPKVASEPEAGPY